jgi:hypothetical protein
VNVEPWHGHTNWDPENPLMVQPSWVHTAVKTLREAASVRARRNVPIDVCVIAIPPVVASGEPAAIGTETVRPLTVAPTEANDCALSEGPVGLPPQPAADAMASAPAAFAQHEQNSRRVGSDVRLSLITLSPHQVNFRVVAALASGVSKKRDRNPVAIHSVYRHS